jgi:hypothetical protein
MGWAKEKRQPEGLPRGVVLCDAGGIDLKNILV